MQSVFTDSFLLADAADPKDVEVDTVWTGSAWRHTITLPYRPELPVSHTSLAMAGDLLTSQSQLALAYCGCAVTVNVESAEYFYMMATDDAASPKNGRCRGAYSPKGNKGSKKSKSGAVLGVFPASSGSTAGIALGLVGVGAAVGVLGLRRFRQRQRAVIVDEATALLVPGGQLA